MLEIAQVITKRFICVALNASLCVGTLGLAACNNQSPQNAPAPSATAPAPASTAPNAPAAYVPPSADQLYQLVAPIALFPDKLVAQVLAGSTYPDQITAADDLLAKNSNLKGTLLQTAIDPQPWDPSVKGLTAFPSVLDQMAKNIQWTTSLGTAYVNDPTDVMNAIQVMRQRASKNGSLVSNTKQRLVTTPVAAPTTTTVTTETETDYPPTYAGPEVVPAPQETIQIEPAESDVVYVPSYNPQTVYGAPVAYYPGYAYDPGYSTGDVVVAGAIGFGAGILIANLFDHHDNHSWGWNSWGMRWGHGGGYRDGGYGNGGYGNGGGWVRPAVVHNDNIYVSRSNTVINRYTNNVTNNVTNNNRYINNSVNNSNNNNNNREGFNRTVQNNAPNNPNNPNGRFDPRENPANRPGNEAPRAPNTLRPGPVAQMAQPHPEARGPMTTPNFQNAMQHDQRIQAMRAGETPAQAQEAARTSQRMQPFDARQQEAAQERMRQANPRVENTPRENPAAQQRLPVAPSFHNAAPEAARAPQQNMEQQQRAASMQQRQMMEQQQARSGQQQQQQQRAQQEQREAQQQQQQREVQQQQQERGQQQQQERGQQQQRMQQQQQQQQQERMQQQQQQQERMQQQRMQQQPRQEAPRPAPEHRAAPAKNEEHGDKHDDNHHKR